MSLTSFFRTKFSQARSAEDVAQHLSDLERNPPKQPKRAIAAHREAVRLAAQHGLHDAEARNSYQLGLLLRTSAASRKAEAALARAADIWEAQGDFLNAGDALLARAGVCLMDRRVDAAQTYADQAIAHFKQVDALTTRPQVTRLLSAIAAMRAAGG